MERSVDGIDWQTRAGGDPTGVRSKGGRAGATQDSLRILPRAGLVDVGGAQTEATSELANHPWCERATAAKNLRERGVIGAEVASESAQRVAPIALPALAEFGRENVP